jgi:hypothetical protein
MRYLVAEQMRKSSSKTAKESTKRPLGLYRGQIWMAPDFNAPMEFIEVNGEMLLVPERSSATKKKSKSKRLKSARKNAQL